MLKKENLTTIIFSCLIKQDNKLTLDEKKPKYFLMRLKIEKKIIYKRHLGNILTMNLLHK